MRKKTLIIGFSFVVLVVLGMIGLTYAFFTARVEGNEKARETVVETAVLKLRYTDGPEIEALQILPGWSKTKKFTVENIGTVPVNYTIWWKELYNTFLGDELVMSLECKRINEEGIEEGTCEGLEEIAIGTNSAYPIKSNIKIEENITHEYTFKIEFKEIYKDQNYNQGAMFNGIIQINEYDEFEYMETQIENVKMSNYILTATLTNPNKIDAYALTYNKEEEEMLKSGVQPYNLRSGGVWKVVEPTERLEIEETVQDYEVKLWARSTSGNITYEDLTPNPRLIIDSGLGTYNGSTGIKTYSLRYKETKTIEDATREGYTFTGWSLVGGEVSKLENKVFTMGINETKLTANYTANKYKLTTNPNGGNYNGSASVYEEEKETDSTKQIIDPTREGYTFTGWDIEGTCEINEKTLTMRAGECTIKATWQVNTYKWIVYHNQMTTDGTGYTLVDSDNGEEEYQKTITLPLKTYTGFTSPSEKKMTIKSDESKNVDEYNYTRNQYDLVIKPAGGTYNGGTTNVTTKEYYGSTKTIASPSRMGYTFNGWTKTGNSTLTDSTLVIGNEDTTLEAKWTANTYDVDFNLNGGSGTANKIKVTYDSTYGTLPTNLSKTGYTFAGWYTLASGGAKIESTTKVEITSNQTLYAHWTANTYTITLNKQSGSGGTSTIYLKYNTGWYSNSALTTSLSKVSVPTREGYLFRGYYTSTNGGGTQVIDASGNIKAGKTFTNSAKTIYAYWIQTLYGKIITAETPKSDASVNFKTVASTSNGQGLMYTADASVSTYGEDGKKIYYYRGDVENNWVSFAGYKWRIVRTTSEGGVKLIYSRNGTSSTSGLIKDYVIFNKDGTSKYHVGYTYNTKSYTSTQTDSSIKKVVDAWYNASSTTGKECLNWETDETVNCNFTGVSKVANYSGYLSETAVYCADRTESVSGSNIYFGAYNRFYDNAKRPTFACPTTNASRYTVSTSTGNGYLSYPIALLTADEAAYAGVFWNMETTNLSPYLLDNTVESDWWTMSPSHFEKDVEYDSQESVNLTIDTFSGSLNTNFSYIYNGVRPVISLKACVTVTGTGNGTKTNPYTLSNSFC